MKHNRVKKIKQAIFMVQSYEIYKYMASGYALEIKENFVIELQTKRQVEFEEIKMAALGAILFLI